IRRQTHNSVEECMDEALFQAKKIKPIAPHRAGQPQVFTVDVSVFQAHLPQSLRYSVSRGFLPESSSRGDLPFATLAALHL
ncbi:MAG: hypothetical protein AAF571_10550, partial [Verrucomicrobiota bacterium]